MFSGYFEMGLFHGTFRVSKIETAWGNYEVLQRVLTFQPPSLNGKTKKVIIALDETSKLLASKWWEADMFA